jgi:hypothetical protein
MSSLSAFDGITRSGYDLVMLARGGASGLETAARS